MIKRKYEIPIVNPIVSCQLDGDTSMVSVSSNHGNFEASRNHYKHDRDRRVIYIDLKSKSSTNEIHCYAGLTVEQAEELRDALDEMVKLIKGE